MSRVEVDVLRSAIVFTSAGLDASMKRLVNDAARALITKRGSGAYRQYQEFLKAELAGRKVSDPLRDAILAPDVADKLVSHYLSQKTKASFQGSGDLKSRVRQTLGIAKSDVSDQVLEDLDEFFVARNKIAHEMDLKDASSESIARIHRTPDDVASMCAQVFDVTAKLVRAAASTIKGAGV